MEDEYGNMAKEITRVHKENQMSRNQLVEKKNKLLENLEKLKTEQERLSTDLAAYNSEIELKKEIIENLLNDNGDKDGQPKIGIDELTSKCKMAVSRFIIEIPEGSAAKNLLFRIEYGKMIIMRTVEDENMTFFRLKQETKIQFDKDESEFYFCDELGQVYLDDLNVKKALFPLTTVTIKEFLPVIRVQDKRQKVKNKEEVNLYSGRSHGDNPDMYKMDMTVFEKLFNHISQNFYELLHALLFAIFLYLWITSCIFFRNIDDFYVFQAPFTSANYITLKNSTVSFLYF